MMERSDARKRREQYELLEQGRRLASERDDLIAQGVNPSELLVPLAPAVEAATVGLHEAFDRVHDGARLIDPERCALALFVLPDGHVHLRSPYTTEQVAAMLAELALRARNRAIEERGRDGV